MKGNLYASCGHFRYSWQLFRARQVLADIRRLGIEQVVCLGDAIQGGAQPAQTIERLRELSCPIVMGNANAWLLTDPEISTQEQVTEQQLAVKIWSLAQLSEDDRAFILHFSQPLKYD